MGCCATTLNKKDLATTPSRSKHQIVYVNTGSVQKSAAANQNAKSQDSSTKTSDVSSTKVQSPVATMQNNSNIKAPVPFKASNLTVPTAKTQDTKQTKTTPVSTTQNKSSTPSTKTNTTPIYIKPSSNLKSTSGVSDGDNTLAQNIDTTMYLPSSNDKTCPEEKHDDSHKKSHHSHHLTSQTNGTGCQDSNDMLKGNLQDPASLINRDNQESNYGGAATQVSTNDNVATKDVKYDNDVGKGGYDYGTYSGSNDRYDYGTSSSKYDYGTSKNDYGTTSGGNDYGTSGGGGGYDYGTTSGGNDYGTTSGGNDYGTSGGGYDYGNSGGGNDYGNSGGGNDYGNSGGGNDYGNSGGNDCGGGGSDW